MSPLGRKRLNSGPSTLRSAASSVVAIASTSASAAASALGYACWANTEGEANARVVKAPMRTVRVMFMIAPLSPSTSATTTCPSPATAPTSAATPAELRTAAARARPWTAATAEIPPAAAVLRHRLPALVAAVDLLARLPGVAGATESVVAAAPSAASILGAAPILNPAALAARPIAAGAIRGALRPLARAGIVLQSLALLRGVHAPLPELLLRLLALRVASGVIAAEVLPPVRARNAIAVFLLAPLVP